MCTDRILVHRDRYREAVDRLAAIADGMTVGDPRRAGTDLGPVITNRAAERFRELISDARAHGADVAAGGQLTDRYARPTVLTGLDPSSRFAVEEGFLPIVEVIPFDDDLDAIAIANSLEEGLIGSVISADRDAAYSLARELRAGAVHVNGPSIGDEPHVPFGGLGASGMGRLGGADSVAFFTDQRTLYVH
jgi:benzaldehyde dehydrogenase (NAD)